MDKQSCYFSETASAGVSREIFSRGCEAKWTFTWENG